MAVAACSSSNAITGITPGSADQTQGAIRDQFGGWISPAATKTKELLYVSDTGKGMIDIFSVPSYSMVGQITSGIDLPEGLATDYKGNLYVANFDGGTVTVYKPGKTSPSLTLTDSHEPDAVAVGSDGYVYVGDFGGGIDVYPPGAKSPSKRIEKPALDYGVISVAVDSRDNFYGAGDGLYGPAVVEFYHASKGGGTNLHLTGLGIPTGVVIDDKRDVVVSDFALGKVLIYPLGQTSPSSTFKVPSPERSVINQHQNVIYIPEDAKNEVGVYEYPSGTLVTTIAVGNFTAGSALGAAPRP